jgi:hypothetical protein
MRGEILDIVRNRLEGKTNNMMLIQQAVEEAEERIRVFTNRHRKPLPRGLKMAWARLAGEIGLETMAAYGSDGDGNSTGISTGTGEIKKITEGDTTIEFAAGSTAGSSTGGLESGGTWEDRYASLLLSYRVLPGEE